MSGKADVARTKVEIDVENHLLGTTVKLTDGSHGKVFSRGARNDANVFLYNCHLCSIPNLPGERCLQTHIAGRKHQTRLALPCVDAEQFRQPLQQKNKIQMNIAPGEPVPPGFENEVKPMAEIQKALDVYKDQPLVGLEYLSELDMGAAKELVYHCILCDKRGDPRTIFAHLTSQSHRHRFLEKHFPSVIKEIQPYGFPAKGRPVLASIFQTVCEAIEDYHGRLTPNVHEGNEYNRNRTKYQQAQIFEKHIDETMGLKFTEVIDRKLIAETLSRYGNDKRGSRSPGYREPKKIRRSAEDDDDVVIVTRTERNSLDSISSISSGSVVAISPTRSRSRSPRRRGHYGGGAGPNRNRRSRSPQYRNRGGGGTSYERSRRQSPAKTTSKPPPANVKKNIPTPKELSAQASEIAHERYKWEKYRCMVELAITEMEKRFKEHEKNPEKHPLYPEEWKCFWNRRYKELLAEKKDPAKHDYKPEWIEFWTRRMKTLHNEEIEAKKLEIRKKMNLPDESKERTDELKEQYLMKTKKKEKSISPISDDDDGGRNIQTPSSRRRGSSRSRSRSRRSVSGDRDRERDRDSRDRRDRSYERDGRREYDDRYPPADRPFYKQYPPMQHPAYQYNGPPRVPQPTPNYDDPYNRPYGAPRPNYPNYGPGGAPEPEEDEGPLTFVSVCRLLTALEDHLGSLGPKVVDLMAKALALEKVKANSADDMLLNDDNCVFFETVKEKLKGQLQANVLHYSKVAAVKRAIKNIAALIHQVTEKNKEKKSEEAAAEISGKAEKIIIPTASKPLQPTVNVEKVAMAQKIAAALVAQGKTDITPEQLEQLIGFYTKMAEAAKAKEQPISTAAFLNDIERKKSPPPPTAVTLPAAIKSPEKKKASPPKAAPVEEKPDEAATADAANALESLTDSDLQTLLQNFKDLSTDEQHHLIAYLKKLESTDPIRVEKLRKYVNVGGSTKPASPDRISDEEDERPAPIQLKAKKPLVSQQYDEEDDFIGSRSPPIKHAKIFETDDEDDDYDFDDVVKTASKNVQNSMTTVASNATPKSTTSVPHTVSAHDDASNMSKDSSGGLGPGLSISETQNLIANLMGSLQKSVSRIGPVTSIETRTTSAVNMGSGGSSSTTGIEVLHQQTIQPVPQPLQQPMMQSQTMNNVPYYYQQQQSAAQFNQRPQQGYNNFPQQQQFGGGNQGQPFGNNGYGQRQPQGYQGGNIGYPQQQPQQQHQQNMQNYPRNHFNNYY